MHIYLKNSIFFILIIVSFASASAMEPVDMPGDDEQEAIPLLDEAHEDYLQAQDIHLEMAMEDEGGAELDEQKPVLFDGSRRFFDDESRKLIRNKAYKSCFKHSASYSIFYTGVVIGAIRLIEYLCQWCRPSSMRDYLIWTSITMSYFLIISSLINGISEIKPAIAKTNPFLRKKSCNVEPYHTIPQPMIDAADTTKIIYAIHRDIEYLNDSCSSRIFKKLRFDIVRHIFFSKKDFEFHKKIQERLENPCTPLRKEYRNLAYQIRRNLVNNLPQELVVRIFNIFPNNNILEYMLSHHPKDWWDKGICHLNEEELLLLMKKSTMTQWEEFHQYGLSSYLAASILAENGWVAFSKSKKYPIQCDMKFFNIYAMPNAHMKRYFAKFVNPTIYLPYSPEIAQYYKFEDDPAYALEHAAPSSKKIERLLQLRQEIVARNPALLQPIPNNNNI